MKKYFLLSVAALGLMFGCQKKEYSTPNGNQSINDDSPALVKLGIDVPTAILPGTKGIGSVEEWDGENHKLTLLAYKVGQDWNEKDNVLFEPLTTNAPESGRLGELVVKQKAKNADSVEEDAPVYYKDNDSYDFFGYYLDDLEGVRNINTEGNLVTIDIEVDGTQDVMAAKAYPKEDIKNSIDKLLVEDDLYSAYSARRGVIPTLEFDHMLSRFNFYVVAASQSAKNVMVEGIYVNTPTKGTLHVAAHGRDAFTPKVVSSEEVKTLALWPNEKLTYGTDLTDGKQIFASVEDIADDVKKKVAKKVPYAGFLEADGPVLKSFKDDPSQVLEDAHAGLARIGSCVMVMPNQDKHDVKVELSNTKYPDLEIPDMDMTISATDIITPDGTPLVSFMPGYQYDVIIMVYGPEEVKISAYLSEWKDGGYYYHDEEDERNEPKEPKAVLKSATATSLTFAVSSPSNINVVHARLTYDNGTQNVGSGKGWIPVTRPQTKLWTNDEVTFEGLVLGTEYTCELCYFDAEGNRKDCTEKVKAVPSDVTARGVVYVSDRSSYNDIPKEYRGTVDWDLTKYIALYYDQVDGAKVAVKFNGKQLDKAKALDAPSGTLMKLTASMLFDDEEEILPGKYEITMSKGTSTSSQTVIILDPDFEVENIYVVSDLTSWNKLPNDYTLNNDYETDKASLPWIVVEFTEYNSPLVTATKEEFSKDLSFDGDLTWLKLNKENLGVDLKGGEWTINVNNVEKKITVQ